MAGTNASTLIFVVMSFASDMDPVFDGIRDAAKSVGLTAQRVSDVQGDYRITDKIIEMIGSSRMVVVDLTHERPNVYFELGYARGIGKKIITTARTGTELHFDVKDWTCIFYNDSRVLEQKLIYRFQIESTSTPSNHARPPPPIMSPDDNRARFSAAYGRFLRQVEAEWRDERDSDSTSIDREQNLLTYFGSQASDFLRRSDNLLVQAELAEVLKTIRKLENHMLFMDGGVSWNAFWSGGDEVGRDWH
jgi:hypothetical protein